MRRAGWIVALATAAATFLVLAGYGVPVIDLARFAAYLATAVTLPGTLLWRAARGRAGLLAVDAAAGTAVGYVVTVLAYAAARAAGAPLAFLAVPAGIVLLFAAVPRLRGHFRGSGERAPAWWSAAMALLVLFLAAFSAVSFFRTVGLTWPYNAEPYPDLPFQLALASELKHHLPGRVPYLTGEPLRYHWFFHAHLAGTSWATGVELQTLVLRLGLAPMLAVFPVLVAAVAQRITGAWAAGPAAVALTLAASTPLTSLPSGWLLGVFWLSPTQTFGATIFAAIVLLLVDLLRGTASRGGWALLALLLAGVAGAKATFLPILVAALLLVAAVGRLRERRPPRGALTALGLAMAVTLAAQVVLYAGSTTGLAVEPLATLRGTAGVFGVSLPGALLVAIAAWTACWAGWLGLLADRARLADPPVLLCLGLGLAGLCAMLATWQPGGSQGYFLQSARPYLCVAAVAGLAVLLRRPDGAPVRRRRRLAAYALTALMAAGAIVAVPLLGRPFGLAVRDGVRVYPRAVNGQLPQGGVEAARWLRDHSDPGDLVATNVHCRRTSTGCDNRSFWVAAYAERRVYVQGWGYAPRTYVEAERTGIHYGRVPFWDAELLARNDAAFHAPSAATLGALRGAGVRWLLVDRRFEADLAALDALAPPVFTAADARVYALPD